MHASSIQGLAERWIASRNTARPSPNTVSARQYDLAAIARLLAGDVEADLSHVSVNDLTVSKLEVAIAAYASSHAASSTRRVMSTWKQFCLWLVRDGHLQSNPLDHIDGPKATPWVPKPLQLEDLSSVAETSSQPGPTARDPWPERDEALFALLIAGGLRISETINLTIGDCYLNDDPPRLRITGKGNKVRVVPIPPEAVTRLVTYLESRDIRLPHRDPEDTLLIRPDGRSMTRSAADHAIRGWFRRAGRTPPKGALAHSFRHTYATMLIDNGASLPEVQQLLGHSDLATTQAYLGVTAKGLEQAALSNPARKLL